MKGYVRKFDPCIDGCLRFFSTLNWGEGLATVFLEGKSPLDRGVEPCKTILEVRALNDSKLGTGHLRGGLCEAVQGTGGFSGASSCATTPRVRR